MSDRATTHAINVGSRQRWIDEGTSGVWMEEAVTLCGDRIKQYWHQPNRWVMFYDLSVQIVGVGEEPTCDGCQYEVAEAKRERADAE